MKLARVVTVVVLCIVGCGARTSPSVEVAALVRERGAVRVHRDLAARVRSHPRDVSSRLRLAEVAEMLGRPAEAIDALVAVERLGGPFGPRWHDADRARLARLLLQRGHARLERGSPRALDDLTRARDLGAAVATADVNAARAALALSELRHIDSDQRAKGRSTLASLYRAHLGDSNDPRVRSRAAPRVIGERDSDSSKPMTEDARLPRANASWTTGDPSWRGALSDAALADRAAFGVWAWQHGARREAYAQLAAWHAGTAAPRDEHYAAFFLRALAWWSPESAGSLLRDSGAAAVAGNDVPMAVYVGSDARADAVARYARARAIAIVARNADLSSHEPDPERLAAAGVPETTALVEIARSFRRSSAGAADLASELVARSVDASIGYATVGALFDALGDPARARTAWGAAVAADDEPAFTAGYAEACARGGDGDAALIAATHAAAAWGDPAVVWNAVARVLLDSGRVIDALTAARAGIDLAGPEQLPDALDLAIEASRHVGRTAQAEALAAQRARIAPAISDSETTAARQELAAGATPSAIDRAWTATRHDAREVDLRAELVAVLPAQDPRRGSIVAELVMLAGDRDHLLGLRAVFALRE